MLSVRVGGVTEEGVVSCLVPAHDQVKAVLRPAGLCEQRLAACRACCGRAAAGFFAMNLFT